MQEYRNLDPEELALDSSFQRWQLYRDPVDSALWQEWLLRNPDKAELVDKAANLVSILHNVYNHQTAERIPLSDQEVEAEISRLYSALDSPVIPVKWFQYAPVRYGMAASVLFVLGLLGWFLLHPATDEPGVTYQKLVAQVAEPLSEINNTTEVTMVVNLPDKSSIVLYPKSRVSYTNAFSGIKREVYLSGKGFFTVTRNPKKPFYVYANGLVTKVLGTSFMVQAFEGDRQIKVVVRTGRVAVSARNQVAPNPAKETFKLDGIVLTPNQQIVYSPARTQLTKSLIADPVLLDGGAKNQTLTFKSTPIAAVFASLEQSYGVKIAFDEELMRACFLTASFADEPLFKKLDLICRTINASYKEVNGAIIISSNGC